MKREELINRLKENGCRMTGTRETILDLLLDHQQTLISVDDLHKQASSINPSINQTTVYRNIQQLEELDLLYVKQTENTAYYKLVCHSHHHHHIICLGCQKMVPIDYCPIKPALEDLVHKEGFSLTDHHMELYGYCSECQSKTSFK